ARAGTSEWNPDAGLMVSIFIFVGKIHALLEEAEEVIVWGNQLLQLIEEYLMVNGGEIIGNVPFDNVERRPGGAHQVSDTSLAVVQAINTITVCIRMG